ncbi:DUF5668 domain-containing protein [Alkalihalobacillus oceani]|uniref:DUF5668 domain-containing protein n=1 Tax=Halalkalibacter oceani TaxID=1653776 RepID=A0A9X2DT95_9BACI|nr:DUF5668 domain-containing protein [Halalkalibacter oceani]MCM3715077.1 DUF5668 domain-containing protein [Halalkalibacter oceani]
MKQGRIFPGFLLIGIGCYFLLQQLSFPFAAQLLSWPSILIVIGIAFLAQGYWGRESSMVFPGSLLTGLGVHFHGLQFIASWPDHWGMYPFIISLAFFLSFQKTKRDGLIPAIILLIIAIISFTSLNPFAWLLHTFAFLGGIWPLILIALGIILLIKR